MSSKLDYAILTTRSSQVETATGKHALAAIVWAGEARNHRCAARAAAAAIDLLGCDDRLAVSGPMIGPGKLDLLLSIRRDALEWGHSPRALHSGESLCNRYFEE